MSWGMVAGAAVSAVAGYAKSRSDKKAAEKAKGDTKELSADEARLGMQTSRFESALEYYWEQKRRSNTERGLQQFRKFSNLSNWAPNYKDTSTGIVVPEEPNVDDYVPPPSPPQPKKKKRGLFDKITDPAGLLGGKAGDYADPAGLFH